MATSTARKATAPVKAARPVKAQTSKPAKPAKTAARKPVGRSLHLGLNAVSPKAYGGWSGDLVACEFDAKDLAAVAKSRGIKPTVLLTKAATRAKVLAAMRSAAKALKAGDLFVLSYSGHGGQVADVTGDERDHKDETWCLYDGQLIDDELYLELARFAKGVRILVLSDSCHSGTVTREAMPAVAPGAPRPRMMPPAVALRTYREHQAFYDKLQRDVTKAAGRMKLTDPDAVLSSLNLNNSRLTAVVKDFNPAVVLISGCMDNQTSSDGDHNGLFTARLLQVWHNGAWTGDLVRFHARIRAGMPADQSPNLFVLGDAATFLTQTPFTV